MWLSYMLCMLQNRTAPPPNSCATAVSELFGVDDGCGGYFANADYLDYTSLSPLATIPGCSERVIAYSEACDSIINSDVSSYSYCISIYYDHMTKILYEAVIQLLQLTTKLSRCIENFV